MNRTLGAVLITALTLASGAGCNSQDVYNSDSQQQDLDQANAKTAELKPAVGTFCGQMHMIQSDQDFAVTLTLQIVPINEHPSTSQDPTQTIQVPMLQGPLRFPVIDSEGDAAYNQLQYLMQATGGFDSVNVNYGDYNSANNTLNLPYSLNGQTTGNYGALNGTLNGNSFQGQWFSNSSQLIGNFVLTRSESGCSS